MKLENNKIKSIIDALLSNSLEAESTEVNINITKNEEDITIKIEDNGKGMDEETLNYVKRVLKQPYRKDMEEYYGQLAGKDIGGGGLNLVGLQINQAEIESSKGEGTKIIVKRNRNY